jgi:hypothetical protein
MLAHLNNNAPRATERASAVWWSLEVNAALAVDACLFQSVHLTGCLGQLCELCASKV